MEVSETDDHDPVEALTADRADPAFGVRPRLRRPHRRLDDADPFRAEDFVELACELAVPVADEEQRPDLLVV